MADELEQNTGQPEPEPPAAAAAPAPEPQQQETAAEAAAPAAGEAKPPQQQQQRKGGGGGGGQQQREKRPEGQRREGGDRGGNKPPQQQGQGGGGDRGPRREGGGDRGGDRGPRREGGPGGRPGGGGGHHGGGGDRGGFGPPLDIDLEKLISDSLYLDNQAHAVVARLRDMDSGTKSQLRRFYNAVRRACRTAENERQHEFVMLRARLAYTNARHSLRSMDALEKLLLQVTRKNTAADYDRFRDLFEAIVAYNE